MAFTDSVHSLRYAENVTDQVKQFFTQVIRVLLEVCEYRVLFTPTYLLCVYCDHITLYCVLCDGIYYVFHIIRVWRVGVKEHCSLRVRDG